MSCMRVTYRNTFVAKYSFEGLKGSYVVGADYAAARKSIGERMSLELKANLHHVEGCDAKPLWASASTEV